MKANSRSSSSFQKQS